MYINFHKFNYQIVEAHDRKKYEDRDKEAYKKVLRDWFETNLNSFIVRKWEIEEIHYLKEIGDFIKLIREAESLYELGFYTSCIALVGVSAEDFSKYLAIKHAKPLQISDANGRDVSQYNRLKLQLADNIIVQDTYDLLDEIRSIRNDCLHYNQGFKQKQVSVVQSEAIKSLNNLKLVLKKVIGTNIDSKDFLSLMKELHNTENARSFEEIVWKQKNMTSHLLNFSTVQEPGVTKITMNKFFKVTDLDEDEIELTDLIKNEETGLNLVVFVDINDKGARLIAENSIAKDNIVLAEVYSDVAEDGQTRLWYINQIAKVN